MSLAILADIKRLRDDIEALKKEVSELKEKLPKETKTRKKTAA